MAVRPESERRILTVVRYPIGGIRTYLLYTFAHLVETGFRFTFLGPADASFRSFRSEIAHWPGVEAVEAPLIGQHCLFVPRVRQLLRTRRFSLVHSQGLGAASQVAVANWATRVPHVVTSHYVFAPGRYERAVDRLRLAVLSLLLSRADAIVSVSHDAQTNLADHLPRLRRDRLVLIPSGIDLSRTLRSSEEASKRLRAELNLPQETFLMGYLGRFMEEKGFPTLLDAIDRLARDGAPRPFHLLAVGSGDYIGQYTAEVVRRGLASNVTFLPFVRNPGPLLRQLDLMVMPSRWEAAGLLAMEALVLGVPVLGSNCMGLRETLADTPSRTARPDEPDDWAKGLREAMETPWTENARAYALEAAGRFDARRSAKGLDRLYHAVTSRAGRTRT